MKISLRLLIPLSLLGTSLLIGLYVLKDARKIMEAEVEKNALHYVSQRMTLLQGSLEHSLRQGDKEAVQKAISDIGVDSNIDLALLIDERNRILAATRFNIIDQLVEKVLSDLSIEPELISQHIKHVRDTNIGDIHLERDRKSLIGHFPVSLGVKEKEIRPSKIGIILLKYNLIPLKKTAHYVAEHQVLIYTIFLTATSCILWIFFHFVLTRRISHIVSTTEHFATGNLQARTGMVGNDEIGRIGKSFDHMADTLSKSYEELEIKIQERTAELQETNEMLQIEVGERIRAEEILKRLSSQDGLTGIANRRYFDIYMEREWRRAMRDNSSITIIMCDIDFFKAYNDTYGHQMGDDCLKKTSEAIGNAINRPGDMVARYGGEEFVVVLTNTDIKGASFVAEAIRKKVEAMGILHEGSSISKVVTISLGVASAIPSQNSSPNGLVIAADKALYQAKLEGRNRVVTSTRI